MTSLNISGPYFWSGIARPGPTLPPPMTYRVRETTSSEWASPNNQLPMRACAGGKGETMNLIGVALITRIT